MRKSEDVYWSKDPKIRSKTFDFSNFHNSEPNMFDRLFEGLPPLKSVKVTVTEIRDGWNWWAKYYWVFSLPVINATYSNGKIAGEGKAKYQHIIKEAIKRFQLNGTDESKAVKICDDYILKPAVMYDITDYHVFQLDEYSELKLNYSTKNYDTTAKDKQRDHNNVRIALLPIIYEGRRHHEVSSSWKWFIVRVDSLL
ncbi:hypothetical protein [Paenibacillus cremeus]|uniref:Uncharacterized protein n=1 Tax=Paenibacillus cremeus TaxID=2163881 RepID=A0A559KCQ1_9BACL|nr:hypothetical protein [Paenibacillus cremeus]TVY09907.1 hypothetical protein FPZ49_11085 [Paenibacillus cremeus]